MIFCKTNSIRQTLSQNAYLTKKNDPLLKTIVFIDIKLDTLMKLSVH